jgi:hypothetical protein
MRGQSAAGEEIHEAWPGRAFEQPEAEISNGVLEKGRAVDVEIRELR